MPAAAFAAAAATSGKRAHRPARPSADSEPLPASFAYTSTVSALQKEADAAVRDAMIRGDITVSQEVTPDELDEMEVDRPILLEDIADLKKRLSIKLQHLGALEARRRVAHKVMAAAAAKKREGMRAARMALMRQRSEAERADPPKDLTMEGIEPNP